jgi:hypothetical protein
MEDEVADAVSQSETPEPIAPETVVTSTPTGEDVQLGEAITGKDTKDSAQANGEGHSGDFDYSKVDLLRDDPNTLPAHLRPVQGLAKNFQAQANNDHKSTLELQKQMADTHQRHMDLLEKFAPQGESDTVDPRFDPNLSDEERSGIQVVENLQQRGFSEMGITPEWVQSVNSILTEAENNKTSSVNDEVVQARQTYGDDIDNYGSQIQALRAVVNPATEQRYTTSEAYALVTGRTGNEAQMLKVKSSNARQTAKRSVATGGVATVDTPGSLGGYSDEDAISEIGKLGINA